MNKIPQHQASEYFELGMVLHHFSSHDISHAPICYAHQDDYYILGFLKHGAACGIIDFKELHLASGDVFFVLPGQVHRFVSSVDAEGWLLMTDSKFVGNDEKHIFDNASLSASSFEIDENRKDELEKIAILLNHRLNDGGERKADAVAPRLTEAFVAVMAEAAQELNAQQSALSPRHREIVLLFRRMLSRHISTCRQPSYYASLLNISTVYLNEVVKKVTGMSTALYIKGEVVLQAKRMLVHTSLSVKEIADRLGFDDYAYFSRLFSQTTGVCPTEFRQRNLG